MSLQVRAQTLASKICTVCGTDVSDRKRTKDTRGRYYCTSCWDGEVERHRRHLENKAADPAPAHAELMPCEACGGRFITAKLTLHNGRVVCEDCTADGSADANTRPPLAYAGPAGASERPGTTATNFIVFGAILFAALPPLGIPLQVWAAARLLRLAKMDGQQRWLVGAGLPWVGLVVLKRLLNKAGAVTNIPAVNVKPSDRWERERYRQLLTLNRVGCALAIVPYVLGTMLFGRADVGLLGVVGLLVCGYASLRLLPFRRTLREAAGRHLWFTGDPVQAYEKKLAGADL